MAQRYYENADDMIKKELNEYVQFLLRNPELINRIQVYSFE